MWQFLVKRLFAGVLTLFCVATIGFFITRFAPGSPLTKKGKVSKEAQENLKKAYGLDRSLMEQYVSRMAGYVQGDFGTSFRRRSKKVEDLIYSALKKSLVLGVLSILFAMMIGIPIGVFAAQYQQEWPDHLASTISVAGICIPNFLLGPLLIMIFGFWLSELPWFNGLPIAGWPKGLTPSELSKLILPVITLSMMHIAYIARLTRSGMLDVLQKDYVRTARAKGAGETTVVFKHALKNGISPVISYLGPMAAVIVSGSIVVEQIFGLPGLGRFFVKSAKNRDYPVLIATIIVFSTLIILFNLLVDIAYSFIDPQVEAQ